MIDPHDPHAGLHSEQGALPAEHLGRVRNPIVKVHDLAWLEFQKPDLERAELFARAFGFTTSLRTHDRLHLRGTDAGSPYVGIRRGARSRFIGPAFKAADPKDVLRLAEATGRTIATLPDSLGGVTVDLVDPGATVTEDELRDWARERLDRTAAPQTVTILAELPLTTVGKLSKLALRTDAARRELLAALDQIAGVYDIEATIEGSSIVATVSVLPTAQQAAVNAILGRYAIEWRLVVIS
jgi:hypothetical protein